MTTSPIEIAYRALADRVAGALEAAGFLTSGAVLAVDPDHAIDVDGEATDLTSAAVLQDFGTAPGRTTLGGGTPGRPRARYAVERQARLGLFIAGVDREKRDQVLAAALGGVAGALEADPTLAGAAERCGLTGLEPDDLPPNGQVRNLLLFVRVRSGDPLGLTP